MTDNVSRLFDDFEPVTDQQWEMAFEKALRGTDRDSLEWRTLEGLEIPPYYASTTHKAKAPIVSAGHSWKIIEAIEVGADVKAANAAALHALETGVDGLRFYGKFDNMLVLLHRIDTELIELQFDEPMRGTAQLLLLEETSVPRQLNTNLAYNPLGELTFSGSLKSGLEEAIAQTIKAVKRGNIVGPNIKGIAINGSRFHAAGATLVDELALSLSMANETIAQMVAAGEKPELAANSMDFTLSSGSLYFPEIAKLRAFRLLWPTVCKGWNVDAEIAGRARLHVTTSPWTQTVFDRHTNLLRSTTQAMSAILGGCDSLSVIPFDAAIQAPDQFSARLARNIQYLLREEGRLSKVADASAGSTYIESLTEQVADQAWARFQEIEGKGSYLAALRTGFIQEIVATAADKKRAAVASGKLVFLGVNRHPDPTEAMPASVREIPTPSTGTEVQPIPTFRATAALEAARMASTQTAPQSL